MQPNQSGQSAAPRRHPLWLMTGFWICVVIAVAVVIRRLAQLISPSRGGPPQMVVMDNTFASHAALTMSHIVPALIFVILAVAVLLRRAGSRWLEQFFFAFGLITGVTAYLMNMYAIGGWIERSAVLVFDTWFLYSLGRAYWFYRNGQSARKRQWMTRAVGILLGIATTRPVMGVFFATSRLTHLSPTQFFGIAFWVGFSINAIVVELWLHSRRRAQLHQPELNRDRFTPPIEPGLRATGHSR
jgi:hypothetical protein